MLHNDDTTCNLTSDDIVSSLIPLIHQIPTPNDAHEFVRIYLDIRKIEDRDSIYDALGALDDRFVDLFVARLQLHTGDFKPSKGMIRVGGKLCNAVRDNGWHGVLYIKGGLDQYVQSVLVNPPLTGPIIDTIVISTRSFLRGNEGTVAIPHGRKVCAEVVERKLSGILEIRTAKYQEPAPTLRYVNLSDGRATPRIALVDTEIFNVD